MEIPQYMLEMISAAGKKDPQHIFLSIDLLDDTLEKLKAIPFDRLKDIDQIKTFHMRNHALTRISPRIEEFRSLQWLELSDNLLTDLPKEIGSLQALKVLRIADCAKILDFDSFDPFEIGNNTLFESPFGLERLPSSFGNLQALTCLKLDGHRFRQFPEQIFQLSKLNYLDLSWNLLEEIPEGLGNLKNLNYLKLSRNNFHELPQSIGQLKKLQRLRLDNLHLFRLPESIGDLESLEMMEMCYGRIEEIPSSIKNLKALKHLYLIDTEISDIDLNMLKVFLPDTNIILKLGG